MTNTNAATARFKTANSTVDQDIHRRFGYSGGTPNLTIPPKSSGLFSAFVPGGQLLLFAPLLDSWSGPFDRMKGVYPKVTKRISPNELQGNVRRKFYERDDMGYRDLRCLDPLPYQAVPYTDEAFAYFEAIHFKLECPFGLEAAFISGSPGNVGAEHYQACPTCRLESLQSDKVTKIINESQLDKQILKELRATLIESCEATLRFAERKIRDLNADIEGRQNGEPHGRTTRNDADYIYLKMAHKEVEKKQGNNDIGGIVAAVLSAVNAQKQEGADPEYIEFLAKKKAMESDPEYAAYVAAKEAEIKEEVKEEPKKPKVKV